MIEHGMKVMATDWRKITGRQIIMTALFTATLVGWVCSVQAAPPANPLELIGAEVLRENCNTAEWMSPPAGEDFGPAMEGPCGRHFAGEMRGEPGMRPFPGRFTGEGSRPPGMMPPDPHPACLLKLLDLTDVQKKQIVAVMQDQKERASSLLKKRSEMRRQLHQAERAEPFNEKAVRNISGNLAQLEADLIVTRVKARGAISAVLTPAQRDLVKKLEPGQEHRPEQSR